MVLGPVMQIGLIGCGRWGKNRLRDLIALGCEVSVVDVTVEACRRALKDGAVWAGGSLADLPDQRGFVVATPTSTHAEVVEDLLSYQLPVFVEKPLTNDLPAARRIVDKAGERVFVMDKWRYHPGIEELRRVAESKELGNVLGLRLTHCRVGHSPRGRG